MTSRGHPFAGAGAGRGGAGGSGSVLLRAGAGFALTWATLVPEPGDTFSTDPPCPHLEMATSNQPTTRELANLWAELTQTQPYGGQGQTQSFAVLFLGQWVGEAAGAAAGERLGGSGLLSGRTAPARTGGVPGGSPWTRSMDAQGRPWLRSAGWGRTAGVAGEEGGGANTEPWGWPRRGKEMPSRPQVAARSTRTAAFKLELPVTTASGLTSQFGPLPGSGDKELVLGRPGKSSPAPLRLEAESVHLLPTWGSLASVPASGADRLLSLGSRKERVKPVSGTY